MALSDLADPIAALWAAVDADRADMVDRAVRLALPSVLMAARQEGPGIVDRIRDNPKRAAAIKGAVGKVWRDYEFDREAM